MTMDEFPDWEIRHALLGMPEIAVELPQSEIYEGVTFPDPEPDAN